MPARSQWRLHRPTWRDLGGESQELPPTVEASKPIWATLTIQDRTAGTLLRVFSGEEIKPRDLITPDGEIWYRIQNIRGIPGAHEKELLLEKIER